MNVELFISGTGGSKYLVMYICKALDLVKMQFHKMRATYDVISAFPVSTYTSASEAG